MSVSESIGTSSMLTLPLKDDMTVFKQETEKFVSRLIENANVLVLYLDKDGKISLYNKKIEDLISDKKEALVGKFWHEALTRTDKPDIKQQMLKAILDDSIQYKRPNNFEGLIADKDNNERLINWSITPILKEDENIEGILLIGNDVSELKEREASLKKIDETLKNIFLSIKEYALFVINLDGNITYYGMGSEILLGWQKKEIIFKNISTLFGEEDAKSQLEFILNQARKLGKYELEMNLVAKDGQAVPVTLTVNQFLDPEGKLSGFVFIAKDITERKKLEYQIFQAEKMAAIGQMAAGLAHEINNPLFVISGRLEMLLERKKLPRYLKESLDIIVAQADRVRKLVDRMLKFSRTSSPQLDTISINDTINNVLPLLAYHKLPDYKIDIQKELEDNLPPIKGDLNQLQEVFLNLFINAYQSMREGGNLSIKTSKLENAYAQIIITDTGCGIAPQNLKNIFMPFFSTKKEGTGLGLSICYNIIKNHNGTIDIESQLGRGTTFIIKLPFA